MSLNKCKKKLIIAQKSKMNANYLFETLRSPFFYANRRKSLCAHKNQNDDNESSETDMPLLCYSQHWIL